MESHSPSVEDLASIFGSGAAVEDFLEGRRPMSVPKAFKMRETYHVPLDLLLVA